MAPAAVLLSVLSYEHAVRLSEESKLLSPHTWIGSLGTFAYKALHIHNLRVANMVLSDIQCSTMLHVKRVPKFNLVTIPVDSYSVISTGHGLARMLTASMSLALSQRTLLGCNLVSTVLMRGGAQN